MAGLVLYELRDGVGVVSFNRPARHNAIDDDMHDEWVDIVRAAIGDTDVRCILLRGEGPSFSSGRETSQLGQRNRGESDFHFVRRHQDVRLGLLDAPKPVVAALRGYALGGGFETALTADMRIAASDAVMGFPEILLGLVVDTGGSQLLTAVAGPSRAKWLLMSGERIDAQQALEWGIVQWVVEPEELDKRAMAIATQLAAAPPLATAMTKQLVDQAWGSRIRDGIRQELLAQTALFVGEEHKRAKAAFIEARRDRGHKEKD